jgi:hypothetical protein
MMLDWFKGGLHFKRPGSEHKHKPELTYDADPKTSAPAASASVTSTVLKHHTGIIFVFKVFELERPWFASWTAV